MVEEKETTRRKNRKIKKEPKGREEIKKIEIKKIKKEEEENKKKKKKRKRKKALIIITALLQAAEI